jgi:hypothetical protein
LDLGERDEGPGIVGLSGGPGHGVLLGVGEFGLAKLGADERGVKAIGVGAGLVPGLGCSLDFVDVKGLGFGVVTVIQGEVAGGQGRLAHVALESVCREDGRGEAEYGGGATKD